MKFSIIAALVALGSQQASAFSVPRTSSRLSTGLSVSTTLDEWQLLDNGSVVGSVRGHPTLTDGDIITTSPLANPSAASTQGKVVTLTGSEYELGRPMLLKNPSSSADYDEDEEGSGIVSRQTLIKGAGVTSLVAGGFALGVEIGGGIGGGGGGSSMTVPEAKISVAFPTALSNSDLMKKINERLDPYGYGPNSLVATSLCCDEVNRPLEKALAQSYDEPFIMGGLAGFPFGGVTSFGAMAHHIPDGGSCLVVYGPHVGIDAFGSVGTVNRRGREKGGACCGSAAAALGKIRKGIMPAQDRDGNFVPETDSLDAQQSFVNANLAPYAERLLSADDRNIELPFALFDAQRKMMDSIVMKGASAMEGNGNIALMGGIQINTPDGISDYFLPLSFDLRNNEGAVQKSLMWT